MNPLRRLWYRRPWRRKLLMKDLVFHESESIVWADELTGPLFSRDAIILIEKPDLSDIKHCLGGSGGSENDKG